MDYEDEYDGFFDLDLLLSLCSGLGRTQDSEDGSRQLYVRDEDCVGEQPAHWQRIQPSYMTPLHDYAAVHAAPCNTLTP